jgi:SAM-dependent methyltransferase
MNDNQIASILLKAANLLEAAGKPQYSLDDLGNDLPVGDAEKVAFDTSKRGGMVDAAAVVPRIVMGLAGPEDKILDFGAGLRITQTKLLRDHGLDVTAYDFPKFMDPNVHDIDALSRQYDIVFASNVLNVSSSKEMLLQTLRLINGAVKPGGIAVFNYPAEPRKWKTDKYPRGIPAQIVALLVKQVFGHDPTVVHGSNSVPVWRV